MTRTIPSRFVPYLMLTSLLGCQRGTSSEPVVFGQPVPQTGPNQAAGMLELQAVRLAVEEANAAGGRRIEVLHADTDDRPNAFLAQATRLLAVNRVSALIGGTTIEQLQQMASPAQVEQTIVVSPSGGAGALLNRAVFTVGLSPAEQGKALARFAAQELKAPRVAVVHDSSRLSAAALAQAFAGTFRQEKQTITAETAYHEANELSALAKRLAATKPAAILFAGPVRDLLSFRDALPKEGRPIILYGGEEPDVAALPDAPDQSEGVYAATAFLADGSFPRAQEFVKRFRERTGQPPTATAALSYDAAHLLIEATRSAPTPKPTAWHDELMRPLGFECLTGPLTFGPNQSAVRPVLIVQDHNGRAELRKRYEPAPPPPPQ